MRTTTKPKTTAADWRIKPDSYNSWALCEPAFDKDGSPTLDKDGNAYYKPFRWYTTIDNALRAWMQMLLADECDKTANDVNSIFDALNRVEERFVEAHRGDLPSTNQPRR